MIRRSVSNLVSQKKPAVSREEMHGDRLMMPFVSVGCRKCRKCTEVCPTDAIEISEEWTVDIGKCIFCMECVESCPSSAVKEVPAPLYADRRDALIFGVSRPPRESEGGIEKSKAEVLSDSIAIRELDTGSCNACEVEVNCMSNPFYDMSRFGMKIVASPRHADVLLVTGPMTRNMKAAALETFEAVPSPKVVVAMGTCAISGGIFVEGDVFGEGIKDTLDPDIYIPGCPPSPGRVLIALLKAFGRD
jgi:Ni,Fe-hydrogenase III small subunit/Pyruvate/2-oxoacid:ferredoxin oxidoreductase delta subunit